MMRSLTMLIVLLVPVCSSGQANQPSPIRSAPQPMVQPLSAVLMTDVDTRHARVGDAVKVRIYSGFVAPGSTRVPPGSVVLGHVTEVSKLVKGSVESRLAVLFDQAQLASGQTVAVHLGIAGLAAAPPPQALEETSAMSAESQFPNTRSTGNSMDPNAPPRSTNTTGNTGGNRVTRKSLGQLAYNDAMNSPAATVSHTAPIATVGSTIPGVSLRPNPTTQSILVSTSTNVSLSNTMPLVLLPIADQQQ
ncbi:hypothetical protein [Terriglobus sp. TAA 43]|uniref:hypothetical protein n=1 Tax=Terriglobus sp. TAA 43 TaxID=278961 RepID=UPI0012ED323D|nr:hypothetical protein [Terriglobus sp. TAA 43]